MVYDDSKATNVGAAVRSASSFDAPVILLLGGRDKGGDFAALASELSGRLRAAVTFGEAGQAITGRIAGFIPVVEGGTLREATRAALEEARPGDVVLLAPACASFDAYPDFAARGEDFQRTIRELLAAERES
jgi:UDP-N-acetylmuramoylalanine--D-glutamate ligase